jgi:hypothetical protein
MSQSDSIFRDAGPVQSSREVANTIMQWSFAATGVACLLAGMYLALLTRTEVNVFPGTQPPAPGTVTKISREHPANWGASEGFAMAGGLCFIAAALVAHRPTFTISSRPAEASAVVPRQDNQQVRQWKPI